MDGACPTIVAPRMFVTRHENMSVGQKFAPA
jgi:hypothetical protein